MKRALVLTLHLSMAFSVALAHAQAGNSTAPDGAWWLSVSQAEQKGFLNGYGNCYFSEFKGPANYWIGTPFQAQEAITTFYKEHPDKQQEPVSAVFSQLPSRPMQKAKPGDEVRSPGSSFDGLYWRQQYALGGRAQQIAFIKGYLTCHEKLAQNKGGRFSKTPAEYVTLISQWYGFDEKTGDVDEKREPQRIAKVLFTFKDAEQKQSVQR
jgi:hypothetical protein